MGMGIAAEEVYTTKAEGVKNNLQSSCILLLLQVFTKSAT